MGNIVEIAGFSGYYVTKDGRVWSSDRLDSKGRKVNGRWLKNTIDSTGYPRVSLWSVGKKVDKRVHRLVAEAYIPNPNNHPCVNHIDEDKKNNDVLNLEWCTHQQNLLHSYDSVYSQSGRDAVARARARDFYLVNPEGVEVKINNLAKFCRENNLNEACLRRVTKGIRKSHKGWRKSETNNDD